MMHSVKIKQHEYGRRHAPSAAVMVIAVIVSALAMIATSMLASDPTPAYADDMDRLHELQTQANEIRRNIEAAQGEYLSAVQMQEDYANQKQQIQSEIETNSTELEAKKAELDDIYASDYKNTKMYTMFQVLFDADTVKAVAAALNYFSYMEDDKLTVINEMVQLQNEHDSLIAELDEKTEMAKEQQSAAESTKAMFDEQLDALAPELTELQDEFTAELTAMPESQQLQESLNYLTDFRGITDTQVAIIRSAYSTPYAGVDRCEAWAEQVYRNAGISVPMLASAWASYATYAISDGLDDIKPGAFIYGSGTSSIYNHVGIYVGNGLVMDNEGSKTGAVTVEEWLSWQTVASVNNGQSGYFGWGYPPGLDFADTNG